MRPPPAVDRLPRSVFPLAVVVQICLPNLHIGFCLCKQAWKPTGNMRHYQYLSVSVVVSGPGRSHDKQADTAVASRLVRRCTQQSVRHLTLHVVQGARCAPQVHAKRRVSISAACANPALCLVEEGLVMPLSLHEHRYLQLFCWCSGRGWVDPVPSP